MRIDKTLTICAFGLCLGASVATSAPAQMRLPAPVPPPMEFKTAEEHYDYLLKQAGGGTQHTYESVPKWEGLWVTSGDSIRSADSPFVSGGTAMNGGGTLKEGVLTPAYEAAFIERRKEIEQHGEQLYDRLTHCEPPGYPRHLLEPYVREFVNTPTQSWWLNDFMNETRRVFIGKKHENVEQTHSWLGDTIGFWDGNKLITHTKYVLPADYFRGQPLTSNQFEGVEVWELKTYDNGAKRLEVQATFYDPFALTKPINAVYTYRRATELDDVGYRIRQWECETTSNSYRAEDGNTNYVLPGEPGYKDARGTTAFGHLPGQSRDPINDQQSQ